MSVGFELDIEHRDDLGKGPNRRLRRKGKVPAVLYGGGRKPRAIVLDHTNLLHQMENAAFYTSILTLKRGDETQAVVVKDVQRHPAKPQVLHLDFQRIVEDEKITLNVPIRFIGEEVAKGVRDEGGEIARLVTDVEVTCLPRDLPEFLELDVSDLELNQLMHLSDVVVPEGIEVLALAHDQDPAVISISPPRREEEEAVEVEEVEEGEEPVDEAAEGEIPAEGAAEEEPSGKKSSD